jgi:hypothetical protein
MLVPNLSRQAKTATYSQSTDNDEDNVIVFSGLSAGVDCNLATAATAHWLGRVLYIKNADSTYNVTIDPDGAETVAGETTLVLSPGQAIQIQANGTNWEALGYSSLSGGVLDADQWDGYDLPADPGADRYLMWDDSDTGSEVKWGSPGGSGDVTAVGNCSTGDCLDGSSDGGTQILFYDAQGATTLVGGDTSGAVTITLPTSTGTLALAGGEGEATTYEVLNTNSDVDTDLTDGATASTVPSSAAVVALTSTTTRSGIVELATNAETVTGTDTDRAVTPDGLTDRLAAPGAIGGTTPAAITGTTITGTSFESNAADGDHIVNVSNTNDYDESANDGDLWYNKTANIWKFYDGAENDWLIANEAFEGNTETRITVTAQSDGTIDFVVDAPGAGDFGAATDLDANGALVANAVDNTAMADDAIGAAEMANGDHGMVSWSSGSATVEDFALNAAADAGDNDIASVDKLEGVDPDVYIDLGEQGVVEIQSDTTVQIGASDENLQITDGGANQIDIGSGSGVDTISLGSISLTTTGSVSADDATFSGVLANTPQAKTYNADDDSETIGTDLTSSVVFITTDNDGTDETVDIQDGTASGQMITFVCVSGCDGTDDSVIIDVETDSTCTGCQDSGIVELGTNGDSLTIVWDGTASAWYQVGAYIQ